MAQVLKLERQKQQLQTSLRISSYSKNDPVGIPSEGSEEEIDQDLQVLGLEPIPKYSNAGKSNTDLIKDIEEEKNKALLQDIDLRIDNILRGLIEP